MGTRADFYVMDHDGSLEWIGSVSQDGGSIPTEILIAGNQIMYEEAVTDYIKSKGIRGIEKGLEGWPWPWADSRMTDYAYIFNVCKDKVWMCYFGSRLVDAVKVHQGMDALGADVGYGFIKFPVMRKEALDQQEETMKLVEAYGSEPAKAV